MYTYHVQYNIGKARYVLCYDDGATYCDGSVFYKVKLYRNKMDLNKCIKDMETQGYIEHNP